MLIENVLRQWSEEDVDIEISHCGICGSDLHTLRSGWKPTNYPCCVGHEIVGRAVKVGNKVERGIKVGDRVGVGAQSSSCLKPDCERQYLFEPFSPISIMPWSITTTLDIANTDTYLECANGEENHCQIAVGTSKRCVALQFPALDADMGFNPQSTLTTASTPMVTNLTEGMPTMLEFRLTSC